MIYRMSFRNVEDNDIVCDIDDQESGGGVTSIEGAEDAIRISCEGEDKFIPIKAKKCIIKFLNSQDVNLRTFATGEDNRFLVTVTINALPIFIGWLEQGDISEPFQYQSNQIVTITAIDGLAFLKDIRLTDDFEANMTNENAIIVYIQNALKKTGHTLNINVINNIREQDNPGHWQDDGVFSAPDQLVVGLDAIVFYKQGNSLVVDEGPNAGIIFDMTTVDKTTGLITLNSFFGSVSGDSGTFTFHDVSTQGCMYSTLFLDAKTFEDRIGDCINCYEVLQRILGHDCFITQAKGEWWIIRVREFRQDFISYRTTYNSNSDVPLSFTAVNYDKAVGLKPVDGTPFAGTPDAEAFFSLARTNWLLSRPNKYARLLYPYNLPLEILCNLNLERGSFISDLADEVNEDGVTLTCKSYDFECWEYDRNVPPDTQDSEAYIKRRFESNVEIERFLHMPQATSNDFYYMLCTDKIYVELKDKFKLDFTVRYSDDLGGGSGHFQIAQAWIRLYGEDGTWWNLHSVSGTGSSNPGSYWQEADGPPDWATFQTFCYQEGESEDIDFTQWQSLSFEAAPCPRSGKLEILLLNQQNASSQEKDFSSLNFEYIPYTNGGYVHFEGQTYKQTQDGEYKASIEEDVFISNSPHRIFKGALLKRDLVNDQFDYFNIDFCYEGQEFLYANDGLADNQAAYGDLQVRAFFNQHRNSDETYHAVCQGMGEGVIDGDGFDDHQDIIQRIFNRDIEPATNDQAFQLVTQDIDLRNCEWTGTMIKNFDQNIGFILDTIIFKYESATSDK